MTLRAGHELHMLLATTLGFVAALYSGTLPPFAWGLLLLLPCASWLRIAGGRVPRRAGTLCACLAVALALGYVALFGIEHAVEAGLLSVMLLVVIRLVTREQMAHDQQALLLALMLIAGGSVLTNGPIVVVWVVSFTATATAALITCQWLVATFRANERTKHHLADAAKVVSDAKRGEKDAAMFAPATQAQWGRRDLVTPKFWLWTLFLSTWVLLLAGLLFVLFPRTGALIRFGSTSSRWLMPNQVALGAPPRGAAPSEVVARVSLVNETQFLAGMYLRGAVYDEPTKLGFGRLQSSSTFSPAEEVFAAKGAVQSVYEIFLTPVAQDLLFALGPTRPEMVFLKDEGNSSERQMNVWQDPLGGLHINAPQISAHRYQVLGPIAPLRFGALQTEGSFIATEAFERHFLTLAHDTDERIVALAKKLTVGVASTAHKASILRNYLLERATYSLLQPNAQKKDPLAAFLFEDPRGHCEYFASAFAVLLRASGIASRVVGGYQGGSWEPKDRQVIFTADNAHVWVEWYLPGHGWVVDDATPAMVPRRLSGFAALGARLHRLWDDHIATFGFTEQLAALGQLTQSWQRLARVTGSWRKQTAEWLPSWMFVRATAVSIPAIAGAFLLRYAWRRRQGDRLARVLWQILVSLASTTPEPGTTARELLRDIEADNRRAAVPDGLISTLRRAIEVHEAQRFGGIVALSEARRLVVAMGKLRQ